ncbi:MAG: extensin-like domain-containing protein [Brevirhabdus sp.]
MGQVARIIAALVSLMLSASMGFANAPMSSPLPIPRPAVTNAAPGGIALGAEGIAADALAAIAAPSDAGAVGGAITPTPLPAAAAAASPTPRRRSVPVFYNATIRPIPRPSRGATGTSAAAVVTPPVAPAPAVAEAKVAVATSPPVYRTKMPLKRPRGLKAPRRVAVTPVAVTKRAKPNAAPVTSGRAGRVCGDRRIRGRTMSPIRGRLAGCGIARPVLVSEVAGVPLSRPATINCEAAKSLADWVERGVKPTVGRYGGGVTQIKVVASYSCRTRNNKPGAKLSEHAKGNAVDVAAFLLKNGDTISVLDDWRTRRKGAMLKKMHKAACGPFGTLLGPDADRYHQDHFHMDVARYRGGAYCR